MKGMIILQGDEEGKNIFIEKSMNMIDGDIEIYEGTNVFRFIDNVDEYIHGFFDNKFVIFKSSDCETTKYLQDYYPFYVIKVESNMLNKAENNFRNGKFLLGCKSDSFDSDMNEVLRLVSI